MIDLSEAIKIHGNTCCYYVFMNGTVYSDARGRTTRLKEYIQYGLIYVFLTQAGISKTNTRTNLATLIAKCFIPNPNNYKKIGFKDGNTHNVNCNNLFWYDKIKKTRKKEITYTIDLSQSKRIDCYSRNYYIFSDGKVYSYNRRGEVLLKPHIRDGNYFIKIIDNDNKRIEKKISDLVGYYFVENNNGGNVVSFKDCNKLNINHENLFWDKKEINKQTNEEKIKFNPRSRRETIVDVTDGDLKKITSVELVGDFYISNTGHVYRRNNDGVFFEKEYFEINGHKNVVLPYKYEYKKKHRGLHQLINVCVYRLVLVHFHTNYSKWRKVSFLDGDRLNCCLSNLKYRCGFNGDIDVEYCKYVIHSNAPTEEILISKYLISKDISYVYDVVKTNKKLIKYVIRQKGIGMEDAEDILSDTMIRCIKQLERGRYKPAIDRPFFVRYFIKIIKAQCVNFYRNNKMTMVGTEKSNAIIEDYVSETRYYDDDIISDESECVEDEISEMFNNLS